MFIICGGLDVMPRCTCRVGDNLQWLLLSFYPAGSGAATWVVRFGKQVPSSSEKSHRPSIHYYQAVVTLHPNKANFLCHFLPTQFIYEIIFICFHTHTIKNYSFLGHTLLIFMNIISIIISFHTFSIHNSFICSCEKKFPINRKNRKITMRMWLKKKTGGTD